MAVAVAAVVVAAAVDVVEVHVAVAVDRHQNSLIHQPHEPRTLYPDHCNTAPASFLSHYESGDLALTLTVQGAQSWI